MPWRPERFTVFSPLQKCMKYDLEMCLTCFVRFTLSSVSKRFNLGKLSLLVCMSFTALFWIFSCLCTFFSGLTAVAAGPGLGPIPMSQFGTISRQISRHNTTSSVSMVSATGTYRRAPSVSSQFSLQQPHVNGGTNASKRRRMTHEYTDTYKLTANLFTSGVPSTVSFL